MAKFNVIKNSFLGGEISPRAMGRTDLPTYAHSCEELLNAIPLPSGGAMRRPGTRYVKGTQGNVNAILIPFIYSETEAYVVEITDGAIRIIANDASRTVSTPTAITTAAWNVVKYYTVAVFSPFTLWDIQYTQNGDTIWLVHPETKPQKLVRLSSSNFIFATYDYPVDGLFSSDQIPFRDPNISGAFTLTGSATTGAITVTASLPIFDANQVGAIFRIGTGYVRMTGYTNGTTMSATVLVTLPSTAANSDYAESSWSNYRGWPRTVAIYQGRLVYGGNTNQPDTIWASKTYNFNFFRQEATDNSKACSFTLSSNRVNPIQWMSPKDVLCIGTAGAEHVVVGADRTQNFGPTNIAVSLEQTTYGGRHIQGVRVGNAALFVGKDGRKIREMLYQFDLNAFSAPDLTVLADHMTGRHLSTYDWVPITQMAWDGTHGVVWAVDATGGLLSLTRDKSQNISSWAQHRIGGHFDDSGFAGTGAAVTSVCVIPSADGRTDEIHICAVRTINGVDTFCVEYMGRDFVYAQVDVPGVNKEFAAVFLDCSTYKDNGSDTTSTGVVPHLIGETVTVVGNGFDLGEQTVLAFGGVTSPLAVRRWTAGYGYTSRIKTVNFEGGSVLGSAQGAMKRIDRAAIKFDRTLGASFGTNINKLESIKFRQISDPMDVQSPLFTGEKVLKMPMTPDTNGQVIIQQDRPFPMTVVGITIHGEVNEVP